MDPLNVYEQFFEAEGSFNGVPRRGVKVALTAESHEGKIKYEISAAFIPREDSEDFRVPYDAVFSETVYEAPGRRSRKREEAFLSEFRANTDRMISGSGASVFWDRPLTQPRRA